MDYEEQIIRNKERLAREAQSLDAERDNKRIALEVAYKEAESLIHEIVQPELERLRIALENQSIPSKISIRKEISALTENTTFDYEIQLSEDLKNDLPKRSIRYTAFPYEKFFLIEIRPTNDRMALPIREEVKFSEINPERVVKSCLDFVKAAFPA